MAVTLTVQEAMLARKIAAKEAVAGSERALAIRDTFIRGISGLSDGEVTINIGDDDAAWLSDVVSVAENEGSDAVWLAERISSQTAATVDMRP